MVYHELTFSSWGLPGDSGQPTFNLPRPIYVSRFKILSFSVPLVEFSIDETCNVLKISDVNGNNVKTVLIPPGSYSSGNIVPTLAAAINSVAGQVYSIMYNEPQRSLTISAPGAFKLLSLENGSTAAPILGIPKVQDVGPGSSLTLPNQIDLNVTKVMLLKSSVLRSRYNLFVTRPGINPLACITTDLGNDYAYTGEASSDWLWCQRTVDTVDLQVVDGTTLAAIKGLANLGFIVKIGILDDDVLDTAQ